ncbi:energy-coupling factor ABC transporter ATP-binding protein [Goodfellowiella coeruleoviolacea]|uniref:Biotin transport system ATP-binding protein n=1 Tax=Goodfellowiella coeruleoviolacea TaxID=334858 RepID=A0AAE3GLB5_9PSEU|nr:ABC transporter ATP-binding protein [Goodfellowiella coeruleoviolacea]MCP2169404.1 biotin transport system ATP-binding protein [Goodfellowiella coeruleoviolacea]
MIRVEGVHHSYDDHPVLHGIDLTLTESRVGIIGANGSGKSTLARMLNGLVIPERGRVLVDGLDTRKHGHRIRQRVGFVFPDADTQIIMPTVAEDVAIGLSGRGLSKADVARRTTDILARYGLAAHHDRPAHLLSGGQKQMLALAAVLVTEPEILICDEPTTLLDLRNVTLVVETLKALPQQVILLTHHLDILHDFDRVLVIDEGRLAFDGAPSEAVDHYRALVSAGGTAPGRNTPR